MVTYIYIAIVGFLIIIFRGKAIKFIIKLLGGLIAFLLLLVVAFVVYYNVAVDIRLPKNTDVTLQQEQSASTDQDQKMLAKNQQALGKNWIYENNYGIWDLYVEGNALERGLAFGMLNKDLLYYQEKVFMDQIDQLVPNRSYQHLLKYFIKTYNRNLTDYVPEENLEEIYAMSKACSHSFDYVGEPYDRQLNFHAAHDLGHAMQDYMLVGCTSFATWGKNSENGDLIIGRNFDFYMGDDFAKNKEVAFFNPTTGFKFAFVTWPGMTGVCSGMNEKGLTVTINAAKSTMPTGSATPISILARRILQYASNIKEAKAIADSTHTFVSESLLIGSATDGKAAIIEKSVEHCALYNAPQGQDWLACSNHYQGADFANDENNVENIKTSDSPARLKRASDLVCQLSPLNPAKAVTILRDKLGTDSTNIGYGNEMALNQLQAHHSVVFNPTKLQMWVSTSPWQEGAFVCYDLGKLFAEPATHCGKAMVEELTIAADTSFTNSQDFKGYLRFRELSAKFRKEKALTPEEIEEIIASNPKNFKAYEIAGDASADVQQRLNYWKQALECRIPKQGEREKIEYKITKLKIR